MKALVAWALFCVFQLVSLLVGVVGLFVVAVLAATNFTTVKNSKHFPYTGLLQWRGGALTWLWANDEDGVDGLRGMNVDASGWVYQAAWINKTKNYSRFRRLYEWSTIRNYANNMRFLATWKGGPFYRYENAAKTFYFQAGWNDHGYPVISAGKIDK